MNRRTILLAALTSAFALLLASTAIASPAPAWSIDSFPTPTNFSSQRTAAECQVDFISAESPSCNRYLITATNIGASPTDGSAVTITDALPPGLEVQRVALFLSSRLPGIPVGFCTTSPVECTIPASFFAAHGGPLRPDEFFEMRVFVTVEPSVAEGALLTNEAAVSGGGAEAAQTSSQNPVSSASPPFGFSAFSNLLTAPDGTLETAAAAHPWELSTEINLTNRFGSIESRGASSVHDPRDILVDLPLGFLGSALAAPTCTLVQLSSSESGAGCPSESRVGFLESRPYASSSVSSPIFNMTPEHGVAAEFGYVDQLQGVHVLYASVVPTPSGYVLRTTGPEIPETQLRQIVVHFYGDPAARDNGREPEAGDVPFFTNPADCSGKPLITQIHMDSWQAPGSYLADGSPNFADPAWASASSESPPVTGCNQLHFKPTIEAKPDTNRGDSPSGLDVNLKVPQVQTVETLATPPLKKAVVTLPAGMSVNPSSANGLAGCSLAQVGISAAGVPNAAPPSCPEAAKIGTVELETPDLPGVLSGQIYVAKQTENPFHTLLAIYIVVNDPPTGVVVKLAGEVKADPVTGQLTTVVDQSPQFPFSELRTHFFGGTKAALRTPAVCGAYKLTSSLTPWSAPQSGPPALPSSSFKISQGCAPSAAEEPHAPSFSAGTTTPTAGLFSPFVLRLKREDGSQELKGLNVTLPPGLLAKLAGVQECPEAAIAAAKAREAEGGGAQELASPSCPAASEVGTVTVGAGAGLTPYYTTGKAYLAGPYKGASLSLAIITPAVAGPYDLGAVVVRTALRVNPETAQVTAVSDPLPSILDGIPLDIRSIALSINRSQFTLNPTSCEKMAVSGEALSVSGQVAPLTNPFQVGGCKALGFKPKLALSLKGGTKRAQNPALKAVVTYPKKGAYANIAKAAVTLPHSEFLDNAHIKTICTRVQFAEGAVPGERCPAASIYGFAKATTPLLDKPVQGPVYLRASSNKLPDLVAALNGQIDVALAGKIDTGKSGGIRNTFEVVPDAPVTKFTLEMQGGKKGLLENSENICAKPQRAVAKFTAQNGKVDNYNPLIANSCKVKKHGKGHKKHKGKK